MFDLDKWQEIFDTMLQNKLRTFLTAFGVFWGIFMLMFLLGSGNGMQHGVEKGFANEAHNSLWIWTGATSVPYKGLKAGRQIRLQKEDLETLEREIPQIDRITMRTRLFGEYTINYKTKNGAYQVFGANEDFFYVNGETMLQGRNLNMTDLVEKRKVIVIGEKVRKVLFGEDQTKGIGEMVRIKGIHFVVVGIFTTDANQGRNEERSYVPYSTYEITFNDHNKIQLAGFTVKEGVKVSSIQDKVETILKRRHMVAPDDKQAIGINNNEENYQQFQGLFNGIRGFVWVVGIGTLIAGIVGISNIMLIIVKERTREIGIRKAIGATPISIVSMILQESVFITTMAGYFGLLAGTGILALMEFGIKQAGGNVPFFDRPEVDLSVAVSATVVLIFSGAFAGLMPAIKAASIKPIEALNSN